MERALNFQSARRVPAEHEDRVVLAGACRKQAQGTGVFAQVMRVLNHVEDEGIACERPVGQSNQEWMLEDGVVDRVDRAPQFGGERLFACGHRV